MPRGRPPTGIVASTCARCGSSTTKAIARLVAGDDPSARVPALRTAPTRRARGPGTNEVRQHATARRADMANPETGTGTRRCELACPHGIQGAAAKEARRRRSGLPLPCRRRLAAGARPHGDAPPRPPRAPACRSYAARNCGAAILALQAHAGAAIRDECSIVTSRSESVVHARLQIPACPVDLAEPIPTARAALRGTAVRAARDRAREVHARYLRHRFFLESANQFMGEHGIRWPPPRPTEAVVVRSVQTPWPYSFELGRRAATRAL